MKLLNFLNDDTCQILLAIIVGIVICYFIFGSCSTGCSRKEGFSVGAPFTDEQYNASPNGNFCELGIEGHFADLDLSGCDPSDLNTANDQCCTGGEGVRDDFNSFMGREFVLRNCSPEIRQQLTNYQARCNQLGEPVEPVEPVEPGPSACISGQTFNAGPDNPGFDPCSPCNQCNGVGEYGIKTNCTTTTDSVCNTLEDIVINRKISIAQDMRDMLLQLMVGDSAEKTELNRMSMEPEVIDSTLQSILTMSSRYDLHFIVLQNTPATTLSQQQRNANLQNFVDRVNIMPGNIGINVPLDLNEPQSDYTTYNLYNSLSKLPVEIQQILYCQRNTLSLREGDFYDPLLKVKTTGFSTEFSCDESFEAETQAMAKTDLLNHYMVKLNNSTGGTNLGNLYTRQDSLFADTGENQLMVVSQPEDKSSNNLLTLNVIVRGNYTYNLDETISVSLPDGSFTLLFTNGMSEDGTPYDSLGDSVQQVINSYSQTSETNMIIWYLSLYTLQYYILKLFMGTDNAFGNTPQLDFAQCSLSGCENTRPDSNQLCTQSGKDYYIMGLVKKPTEGQTSQHSEEVFDPEDMSVYQMLGGDNPLGLYIGPSEVGQKYILAKINTENNCLPLEQTSINKSNLLVGNCNNSLNHGQNCNLRCEDGYTPNDEQYLTLTCRDDGTLSEINQDLACNQNQSPQNQAPLRNCYFNAKEGAALTCTANPEANEETSGLQGNDPIYINARENGLNAILPDSSVIGDAAFWAAETAYDLQQARNLQPQDAAFRIGSGESCQITCGDGFSPKLLYNESSRLTCQDGKITNYINQPDPDVLDAQVDSDYSYTCCPLCATSNLEGGVSGVGGSIVQIQNPLVPWCDCISPPEAEGGGEAPADSVEPDPDPPAPDSVEPDPDPPAPVAEPGPSDVGGPSSATVAGGGIAGGGIVGGGIVGGVGGIFGLIGMGAGAIGAIGAAAGGGSDDDVSECQDLLNTMFISCCDESGEGCNNGYPITCNTDCKDIFEEFYSQCGDREPYNSRQARPILEGMMDVCRTTGQTETPPSSALTHEQIIEMYDINNDGKISTQDLLEILAIFGANLNNAETIRNHPELLDRINQADTNNDGIMDTQDVLNIIRYISPQQVGMNSQDCNDCLTEALDQGLNPNICISSNRCP